MNYSTEKIIEDIKTARTNKQLSQRALSAKTGIAQSHISKIENGAIDITLSTLVELARALNLEVTLIPRKLIPTVQSITRDSNTAQSNINNSLAAWNELKQINKTLKQLQTNPTIFKEIQRAINTIKELNKIMVPNQYLSDLRKFSKTIKEFSSNQATIEEFNKTVNAMQQMRNMIVHIPKEISKPKPAYSLDDNDNG